MYNDLFSIGPITIHGYGFMIGLGVVVAVLVSMYRAKKKGLDQETILDIAIISVITGFLGAKLLFIIVEWKALLENPKQVLGASGFVVYGGIIAAVIADMIYFKIKKLNPWEYVDLCIPQVAVAQGIGRIGCFLAGCCYGAPTNLPIGVIFPNHVMPAHLQGVKVLPTQLFSSAGDLVIAGILYLLTGKAKHKGDIGAFYMILYGVGRFAIEFFRSDYRGNVGFLSTSQFISIFIVAAGVGLLFYNKARSKKEVATVDTETQETQETKEEK